jgi:hypothetical protein
MRALMRIMTVAYLAAIELQAAAPRPSGRAAESGTEAETFVDRMVSVAPQKSELGDDWGEPRVIWIVDPFDDPVEFVNEGGDRDAILSLVRAAISRNGSVAMAEFGYRHRHVQPSFPFPVELTISRYPNRQSLDKYWKELSVTFDSKASTTVVGESAAWLQTTEADQTFIPNRILVFRQGLFTGWIDAVAELGEQPLLHLAEAMSAKIAAERELWDEVAGTVVKSDAGEYSGSFGDVCTVRITIDRPYEILARRQRGWPFVLEYVLNAPDGESTLSVSFSTSDLRSSDEEVSRSPGFSGIGRKKIRVGSREVVFREWSDSGGYYSDASAQLEMTDSNSQLPVVVRIKAHAKDRKKALEDALQSLRLEGRSEPFPPNQRLLPTRPSLDVSNAP